MPLDLNICDYCDDFFHEDDCVTIYLIEDDSILFCKWCLENNVKDCFELVTKGDDNKGTDNIYKIVKEFKLWDKRRITMSPH